MARRHARRSSRTRVLAAALLTAMAAACDRPPQVPRPRNVLLVSIDTLRADRLGAYGYTRGRTPRLDALAERSVVFEQAMAAAPITAPSHATIFTGLYPPQHGVRSNGAFRLAPERQTLAEAMKAAGFRTGAAIAGFPLASSSGLAQGFDLYDEHLGDGDEPERPAAAVVDAALRVLDAIDEGPFFLFVHFYDPHAAYAPPPDLALADPYDGEVAHVDRELGRLLDTLPASTAVVVLSDHGEGLGDHGEDGHAVFVYQSTMHVPLLLFHPEGLAPRRVAVPVTLADVAPTVLDLAGLAPLAGSAGISLLPAAAGRTLPERPLFFESRMPELEFGWAPLEGVRIGPRKMVRAPRPELYDLQADAAESRNLWLAGSADAARLVAALDAVASELWPAGGSATTAALSAEDVAKLEALGYVGAGGTGKGRKDAPDPKDRVELLRQMTRALELLNAGDPAGAERLYREAHGVEPENPVVSKGLARALAEQGKLEEARGLLAGAVAAAEGPMRALLLADRAGLSLRLGDPATAAEDARLALDLGGPSLHASLALAQALEQEQRVAEALGVLETAAEAHPADADPLVARAEVLLRSSRLSEAGDELRRALARERDHGRARYDLGLVELRAGRQEEAVAHLEAAFDALGARLFQPGADPEARYLLAVALSRRGRLDAAIPILEQLSKDEPGNGAVWNALGTALARSGDLGAALPSFERAVALDPDNGTYRENLAAARGGTADGGD